MNLQLCPKATEKALTMRFLPQSKPSAEPASTTELAVNLLYLSSLQKFHFI